MKLPNWFKILWWILLLLIVTYFGWQRYDSFAKGSVTVLDVFVFLIWMALLLIPLFKEVKFFGIELKQEIDSLRKEVKEQIINLRSEIQTSISLQNRINITQNVLTGVSELPPTKEEGKLSPDTIKVLSTLWKHQKDYFGGEVTDKVWTFVVPVGSPNYPEYARGIGEGLRRGYVAISGNGQAMLTVEGIKYCKNNEKDLLPDWNFERWNRV
jgi:hypothetical protein